MPYSPKSKRSKNIKPLSEPPEQEVIWYKQDKEKLRKELGGNLKVPGTEKVLKPKKRRHEPEWYCPKVDRYGDQCENKAGLDTNHEGEGLCSRHEKAYAKGRAGTRKKYREFIEMSKSRGAYGSPIDIDPQTALLLEVQRTAGHVEWLGMLIREIDDKNPNSDQALAQWTPMGLTASVWVDLYQRERAHLIRACKEAISAGVSERQIKLAEDMARMIAGIFKSFMLDPRIDLSPAQRLAAPEVLRELMSGSSFQPETPVEAILREQNLGARPGRKGPVLDERDPEIIDAEIVADEDEEEEFFV